MSYFSRLGHCWVTMQDGNKVLINDVTAFASFSDVWRKDKRVQMAYKIRDGELPHMLSQRLYDTVDYWWTILLFNNIYDLENQWPRDTVQLHEYIEQKYPDKTGRDVHHYRDHNGLVVDMLSLKIKTGLTNEEDIIYQEELDIVTIEDFEIGINEMKRDIFLIDPDYIETVRIEFEKSMEKRWT